MFVIAETTTWLDTLGTVWAVAQMAIGLGVVIFVHELGHFLAAKSCGVKCEKFYVGFDMPMPKILGWQIPSKLFHFQWGETEYGIGILPLGGYVKMLGQDDNPANAEKEAERTRVKKAGDEKPEAADGETEAAARKEKVDHHKSIDDTNLEPQPLPENVDFELDPRSYTAKNVPQRMLIISAGVIMNVIFAVVFATIAYRIGAPYTPSLVGGTVPGGPAWEIDLPAGARVLQVNNNGDPREELRFDKDMSQQIMMDGTDGAEISLMVRERGSDEVYTVKVLPVERDPGMLIGKMAYIGVAPAVKPVLAERDALLEGSPAAEAKVKLQAKDKIIAAIVEGQETRINDYWDLNQFLSQNVDHTITLRVERKVKQEDGAEKVEIHDSEIAPRPLKRLGLVMTMGPITAIQANSPAKTAQPVGDSNAKAGFRKGDVLKAIDGQPLTDPMTTPDIIRRRAGEEVTITVERSDDEGNRSEVDLKVTPRPVATYQAGGDREPVLVDALGLTYAVEPIVTAIDARSDAQGKLKPGDEIVKFKVVAAGDTIEEKKKNQRKLDELGFTDKAYDLTEDDHSWVFPFFFTQTIPAAGRAQLTYKRGAEEHTVELAPYDSDEFFYATRGMKLQLIEEIHQVDTWGEAFSLGLRDTKEGLFLVVTFLKKLVSGDISPTALGGPGTIVVAATSEASRGPGALLLFLTLLSANLAVVNFLPIPVLDGGHMLFLLWEGIFRRPVPEAWQIRLTLLGFAFILCLMAFVIGLDIYRLGGFWE